MHVVNIHERRLSCSPEQAARLLDSLSSPHDALVEDALTRAQVALGVASTPVPWSAWVRLLRRVLTKAPPP